MSNELIFSGDPATDSGFTGGTALTAEVYTTAFVQQGSTVTMTEVGTTAGYRGDMPTAGAGEYIVRFLSGTTLIADATIVWDGSAEITLRSINTAIAGVLSAVTDVDGDLVTALSTLTAQITALPAPLTAQETRDSGSLAHTDGTRGLDGLLKALFVFALRKK